MLRSTPLRAALAPHPRGTRLLVQQAPHTLVHATLRPNPQHPRALATLLEALALWQGCTVHAALLAERRFPGCAPTLFAPWLDAPDAGPPLYSLALADPQPRFDPDLPVSFRALARALSREVTR